MEDNYSYSEEVKNTDKKEEKKPKKFIKGLISMVLIPSIVGVGASVVTYNILDDNSKPTVIYQSSNLDINNTNETNANATSITNVNDKVGSSVVEISTESTVTSSYFSDYVVQGAGSGVIISSDGYIVTNNHVIEGASSITVTLQNGDKYEAEVVARDSKTDIAVLKIDGKDLSSAVFGDSDALVIGQEVVAIGNPLGSLGGTVTDGIISGLNREITINGKKMNLLQTNATINPGNSGGGLFNIDGELVGIVVAKSSGENVEGLGFVIPINDVKEVVVQLIENGYVSGRPSLGIKVISIESFEQALKYGLNEYGVFITEVISDSAADKAGLKANDKIIAVDDFAISNYEDLTSAIDSYSPNDVIQVQVVRNGKVQTFEVTLQENTSPN